nr:MAG TPA: hypothetical protein [Caudoviricetes sp.]
MLATHTILYTVVISARGRIIGSHPHLLVVRPFCLLNWHSTDLVIDYHMRAEFPHA